MADLYGLNITSGMSKHTTIVACGRTFTLLPPGGVGHQSWTVKTFAGKFLSSYRCNSYPKAICRALEEIEKFIDKENQTTK